MQLSKVSVSSDMLSFIGQNYLKNVLCIKKLFYHHKDDELQKILFGEVLYKHNQFPKTTIPLDFIVPCVDTNSWIYHNIKPFHKSKKITFNSIYDYNYFQSAIYERKYVWAYKIYLTFEKEKHLLIKLEYICYNGYENEEVLNNYTIDNEKLRLYITNVYKKIVKELNNRFFN